MESTGNVETGVGIGRPRGWEDVEGCDGVPI
jgi:hypothetical protein